MPTDMRKRIRKYIVTVLVVAAAVAALVIVSRPGGKADEAVVEETAAVKRGELPITIETTGRVQAKNSVSIFPKGRSYDLRITWVIEDGSDVEADDLLMKLESKWLEDELSRYEIDLESRRNNLTRCEEALKIEETHVATSVASAEFAYESARNQAELYGTVTFGEDAFLDQDAYDRPDAPARGEAYQKFRDAELLITKAETDLKRAQTNFDGMQDLLARDFVTRNDFEQAKLDLLEAKRKLESAKLAYHILKAYTYPQELADRTSKLQEAEDALQRSRIEATSKMRSAESSIRSARLSFDRTEKKYNELKEQSEALEIKAPVAGAVIYGDARNPWSRHQISVGRNIWQGMQLFTIPDTSELEIQTRVLEMDIYKIAKEMEAIVTVEAIPGALLKSKITKIAESTSARGWWRGNKWKYFAVELALDEADERLKPGMSCDVEIVVDRLSDVLYVPVAAVFNRGGAKVCYVATNGAREAVEVTTGRSSEKYVEILEGLEVAQKVLLAETAEQKPDQSAAPGGGDLGNR